jgi:hypothetical protein
VGRRARGHRTRRFLLIPDPRIPDPLTAAIEGPHIHVGDYHLIRAEVKGTGVEFWTEGLTPDTKGKYTRVKDA